jgi:hypothetical protein
MRQVKLAPSFISATIQVHYPEDYQGEKSRDDSDETFLLGKSFVLLTEDEIDLVKQELGADADSTLLFSGTVIVDPEDPLLSYSLEELSELERELGYPSTETITAGGQLPNNVRVIQIRSRGYQGLGLERLRNRIPLHMQF